MEKGFLRQEHQEQCGEGTAGRVRMVAWAIVATLGHRLMAFCETGSAESMGMWVKHPNLGF